MQLGKCVNTCETGLNLNTIKKEIKFYKKSVKNVTLVKVAKTIDIPPGKMKPVEIEELTMIANFKGKYDAVGYSCPHLNAKLSEGTLR